MNDFAPKCIDKVFEELAMQAFFSGLKPSEVPPRGYVYRTGKVWKDVVAAIRTGINEGDGKFEAEMACAASRLQAVFEKEGTD